MQAFIQLRAAARERRGKLIDKARREYESTLQQIARLEQDLTGKEPADHKSIASCVSSVIPSDRPAVGGNCVQAKRPGESFPVIHSQDSAIPLDNLGKRNASTPAVWQ
jgi:hypothetical protein